MALQSLDDIYAAIGAGDTHKQPIQKVHVASGTGTTGRCYDLFLGTGIPAAGAYSGTAGVATALTDAGIYHGGDVSTDEKHLLGLSVVSPTGVYNPGWLILMDLLLYYPSLVVTGSPTALDNTVTLPRYTDGKGVMAFLVVQTALGAATPSLTLTYTNSTPTGSRTSSAVVAVANSLPTPTLLGVNGAMFVPLQAGDVGIQSVQSYTINSGGTTGTVCLVLARELARIPLVTVNVPTERDFLSQLPPFPRIYDGASLSFLLMAGGALTNGAILAGEADFVWG